MLISKEVTSRAPWERRLFADRARADPHRLLPPVREKLVISETPFISMWSDVGAELKLSEEEARPRSANFWGPPIWHLDLVEYVTSLRGHYKLGVLSPALTLSFFLHRRRNSIRNPPK